LTNHLGGTRVPNSKYCNKKWQNNRDTERFSGAACCPSTFCSNVIIILYIIELESVIWFYNKKKKLSMPKKSKAILFLELRIVLFFHGPNYNSNILADEQ
jgi:hypothetical protein